MLGGSFVVFCGSGANPKYGIHKHIMAPISPLEIVKRTPKTNCGECGRPTCLAFGAAVAKTAVNPSLCPYIDLTGLNIEAAKPLADQRDKDLAFVAYLKSKVAHLDFKTIASAFGATLSDIQPDTLIFDYLGQQIQLSKSQVLINGIEPEDPRDQILLYNYISSQGNTPPTGNWVGMESLPNSISKIKTLATYCEDRLATLFSSHPSAKITTVLAQLQATSPPEHTASLAAIVPVLPMVPQYLLFWEEDRDDNFAAKVKILFDASVLNYLDLESLVFSSERLADTILAYF